MRAGDPGTNYPNRSDLNTQPNLPVRVATNQTYGKAQAQAQAQRTVPMAPPPTLMGPPGGAPPGPTGSPAGGPAAPPPPGIPPGAFGDIHRPTERPLEPVTAGAALGPGPGMEALQGLPDQGTTQLSGLLSAIAQSSGNSALAQLAAKAAANGQ